MNDFERLVYNFVADYPWARKPIAQSYQLVMNLIPTKSSIPKQHKVITGAFHGFHDKIPWDHKNELLLSHRYDASSTLTTAERSPIQIGLIDPDYVFRTVSTSTCWNWQQGSMLQWLGRDGLFAFNDFDTQPCIRIFDSHGIETAKLDSHMGAAHPNGKYILGYDFGRLNIGASEYGYRVLHNSGATDLCPNNEGLWLTDCHSNKRTLIADLKTLANNNPEQTMQHAYHFVTHTTYSDNGEYFSFLHRWRTKMGRLYSRLFIGNPTFDKIEHLPFYDISHLSWINNDSLIAYGWPEKGQPGYVIINVGRKDWQALNLSIPNVDGHPQVTQGRLMVTDTYPDSRRMQSLYLCDLNSKSSKLVVKTKIPMKYRNARRCDFHPRWNRTGTQISFDSAHSGVRSTYIIDYADVANDA